MGEPRSWGEFMEALVKLIGQAADTGGSQTAGTLAAKGNAILEMLKNGGMPIVKSVQRGNLITSNENVTTYTVNINTVNPDKSVLLLNWPDSPGESGTSPVGALVSFYPDSFTLARRFLTHKYVFWQVVEFY